jgi:hypothetical protein
MFASRLVVAARPLHGCKADGTEQQAENGALETQFVGTA